MSTELEKHMDKLADAAPPAAAGSHSPKHGASAIGVAAADAAADVASGAKLPSAERLAYGKSGSNRTSGSGKVDLPPRATGPEVVETAVPAHEHRTAGISADRAARLGQSGFMGSSLVMRLVLTAACGSFLFGFNISLLNTSIDTIASDFGWCDHPADTGCNGAVLKKAFMTTAVFIGAAAGSLTGGRFLHFGRRMVLLGSMLIFTVGILCSILASAFANLLLARLIVGYGVGIISVVAPVYMAEMTPAPLRGFFGVFHQLFITIGLLAGVLIGIPLQSFPGEEEEEYNRFEVRGFDRYWWRAMLGLGILPVLLCTFLLWWKYDFETPHYYVEAERPRDAQNLLSALRPEDSAAEYAEIQRARDDAARAKHSGLSFMSAMREPVYRHVVLVGCALSAFQQFCGINVFMASSNQLFRDAGLDRNLVTWLSVALMALNLLMTFPAVFLIERIGRRALMLVGTTGLALSVLPGAISMMIDRDARWAAWVAVAGALVFIVFFASTYGPVLWVYLFEIYPIEIKGTACGLATAVNWIAGIVMVFITQFIPVRVNYIIFCVMSFISLILVYLFMRETRGRSLENSPFMVDAEGRPIAVTAVQPVGAPTAAGAAAYDPTPVAAKAAVV